MCGKPHFSCNLFSNMYSYLGFPCKLEDIKLPTEKQKHSTNLAVSQPFPSSFPFTCWRAL